MPVATGLKPGANEIVSPPFKYPDDYGQQFLFPPALEDCGERRRAGDGEAENSVTHLLDWQI